MAALAATWHAKATQPKLAEGQIDWMCTSTLLRARPQGLESVGLLTITTTRMQMQSMRISSWGTVKCHGAMIGDIPLGV
jgi:hypothetical protein